MNFQIGDVVVIPDRSDKTYVIVDLKNYETYGSCCYDRKYAIIDLEKLQNMSNKELVDGDLEWISYVGLPAKPKIVKVFNQPTWEIKPIKVYKVRQRSARTVVVYE